MFNYIYYIYKTAAERLLGFLPRCAEFLKMNIQKSISTENLSDTGCFYKKRKCMKYLIGALLLITLSVYAQEKNTKCRDELAKICPGNRGDGKKIGDCLKDRKNLEKLSEDCRPRRVDMHRIKERCASEITKFCGSAKADGDIFMCLRRKNDALSKGCREAF